MIVVAWPRSCRRYGWRKPEEGDLTILIGTTWIFCEMMPTLPALVIGALCAIPLIFLEEAP